MFTLKSAQAAQVITVLLAFILPIAYIPGFGNFSVFRYFLAGSVALVLALLTIWTCMRQREIARTFFKSWWSYGLISYLAVFMLVSITSVDPAVSFFSSIERSSGAFAVLFATLIAFNCYVLVLLEGKAIIRKLIIASVLGGAILSFTIMVITDPLFRGGGLMGNSSIAAAYMVWQVFLVLYLLLSSKSNKITIWWAIIAIPIFLSPLFINWRVILGENNYTGMKSLIGTARGAFLGCVIGALVALTVWLITSKKSKTSIAGKAMLGLIIIAIVGASVSLVLPNSLLHNQFAQVATEARFIYWGVAMKGFVERPILGWGPGMFGIPYHKYFNPRMLAKNNPKEVLVDQPHNIFVSAMTEGGALLLLALIFFLSTIAVRIYALRKSDRLLAALFLGAFTAWLVQAQFVFDSILSIVFLFIAASMVYAGTHPMKFGKKAQVDILGKTIMGVLVVLAIIVATYTIYLPGKKAHLLSKVYNSSLPMRATLWHTLEGISPVGDQYDSELTFNRVYTAYRNNIDSFRAADPERQAVIFQELDNVISYLDDLVDKHPYEYELILVNARLRHVRMLIANDFSGDIYEEAVSLAKRAVELSPTDPRAQVTLERIENKLEFEKLIL